MIFLLGSGASHPDMPSTNVITERVLSGNGVYRHTNSCYDFGLPLCGLETDEDVNRVIRLIDLIRSVCEEYYRNQPGIGTNYEDYYFVISQIYDSLTGEFDNPAVQAMIEELRSNVEQLVAPPYGPMAVIGRHDDIYRESLNYIQHVSLRLLAHQPQNLENHLQYLRGAIEVMPEVDIFTLNHDTIIEQTLSQAGVVFTDGFGIQTENIRSWQPTLFDSSGSPRLFKLHGSIDWHQVISEENDHWQYAQINNSDPFHVEGPAGESFIDPSGTPLMLMGTFNKMLLYTSGLYGELHYRLHQSLNNNDLMVVCGYGFRDKGINTKIAQWLIANRERRLVVIHHRPTSLFARARGLIANSWESWQRRGQLRIIEMQSQDVSWEDIQGVIT